MSAVYSFKIRGLTTGGSTIATTGTVSYCSDGKLRWTDSDGHARVCDISNNCFGDYAALFREIFTGSSGLDAGTTDEQGHRVFSEPRLKQ